MVCHIAGKFLIIKVVGPTLSGKTESFIICLKSTVKPPDFLNVEIKNKRNRIGIAIAI